VASTVRGAGPVRAWKEASMRRNLLVVMSALGGVVVGARGVIAGTATGRTPVDCIDTVWRSSTVSTSSTTWQVVPGFEARTAIFPITVNVSALVSGAPARFRILSTNVGEQTVVSNPGATRFEPGATGPDSFSYQWVERDDVAAPHANLIRLQWRSPSGDQVSMRRGMALLYRTDGCDESS
jgi:hypothetical protein